jgi:uncharacterized damage-inducible protein DinB
MPQGDWRAIVASALDWEQAHVSLDDAIADLPPNRRGERANGFPHSVWELLDHIRRTQADLLEFCRNPRYHEPTWPDDYWPSTPAPPDESTWERCLAEIRRDRDALARFARESDVDLTTRIPHGTGQTYLRTIIVAVDHTSYHVGQIVAVRRLLGAWAR